MIDDDFGDSNLGRLHRVVTSPDGGIFGMQRRVLRLTPTEASKRGRMALAARLHPDAHYAPHIAPPDEPETIMEISFEGLSEREQEAALAAFPGGKRFILVN